MSENESISLDENRKAAQALSAWLAREMAAAIDKPSSGELSSESAARAIDECADLLSRFWFSDAGEPFDVSPSNGASRSVVETPSLLLDAGDATPRDGLACHAHSGGSDEAPDPTAITPGEPAGGGRLSAPGRLGRFEVRRALGRGGFGVVFLVFDPRLNREAALKIPRPEVLVSPALRQRFLREAQAAAVLDHPNVVPIYETGEIGPVGYILSAFCKGPTLAGWIRQQSAPIAARFAAELTATLADAVQHAHSRGILHRDIKPANVLVEPIAERRSGALPFVPRLSDFGLAKRLDEAAGDTGEGTILGTPHYMAPEQAAGRYREVGVQTDVYSLGVILYELLSGRVPFAGRTDAETLHKIQSRELSPSALRARRVPRDLETICLKCLEKKQSVRYQSAGALAEDLRRFLAGEAVTARKIGAAERMARWCGRNRVVAALAAVVLVSLVGGTTVSTYYALAAGQQAREAQSALAQARKAVDESFTLLSEETLLSEPGMQPLRKELLRKALAYYEQFASQQGSDPGLQAELAQAHVRAGNIHELIGEHDEAEAQFRQAIAIREPRMREDPRSPGFIRELADAYMGLARCQGVNHRGTETEPLFLRAIALREQLAREHPADANYQRELAASYHGVADLYRITRGRAEAEPMLLAGTRIREDLARQHPSVSVYRNDLAQSYHTLAVSYTDAGRGREAETFFHKAIEIRESLARVHPTIDAQRELAQSYKLLASLEVTAWARHEEARQHLSKAIEIYEKLAKESPTVVRFQRDLASGYSYVAELQTASGLSDEAEASYRKAIEIQRRLCDADPSVAGYWTQLADYAWQFTFLLSHQGRTDESRRWLDEVCQAWEAVVREEPTNDHYRLKLGRTYLWSAENQAAGQRPVDAEAPYHRAIEVFANPTGDNPANLDWTVNLVAGYNGLALLFAQTQRAEEALGGYRQQIAEASTVNSSGEGARDPRRRALLHARAAGQIAAARGAWNAILPEIVLATKLTPRDVVVQILCGDAAGLVERWREAADCYARADDLTNHDMWTLLRRARLLLAAGDLAGYRAACAQLVERSIVSESPADQDCPVVLTCVLVDRALTDMTPVVTLAKRALDQKNNPARAAAYGGALYRTGELEKAATILSEAVAFRAERDRLSVEEWDSIRIGRFCAAVLLGMVYRDWGRDEELGAAVREIQTQIAELEGAFAPTTSSLAPWSFRLLVELATREFADPGQ